MSASTKAPRRARGAASEPSSNVLPRSVTGSGKPKPASRSARAAAAHACVRARRTTQPTGSAAWPAPPRTGGRGWCSTLRSLPAENRGRPEGPSARGNGPLLARRDYPSPCALPAGARCRRGWRDRPGSPGRPTGRDLPRRAAARPAAPPAPGPRAGRARRRLGRSARPVRAPARRARLLLDGAREGGVAAVLGARRTRCRSPRGTSAAHLAVLGGLRGGAAHRRHVVHSAIEHSCVLAAVEHAGRPGDGRGRSTGSAGRRQATPRRCAPTPRWPA
jgi:hypothetical protein